MYSRLPGDFFSVCGGGVVLFCFVLSRLIPDPSGDLAVSFI